jgi:hypothetical protein
MQVPGKAAASIPFLKEIMDSVTFPVLIYDNIHEIWPTREAHMNLGIFAFIEAASHRHSCLPT